MKILKGKPSENEDLKGRNEMKKKKVQERTVSLLISLVFCHRVPSSVS